MASGEREPRPGRYIRSHSAPPKTNTTFEERLHAKVLRISALEKALTAEQDRVRRLEQDKEVLRQRAVKYASRICVSCAATLPPPSVEGEPHAEQSEVAPLA
jgi:hypothetical protein